MTVLLFGFSLVLAVLGGRLAGWLVVKLLLLAGKVIGV